MKYMLTLAITPSLWYRGDETDMVWNSNLKYILKNIHEVKVKNKNYVILNGITIYTMADSSVYGALVEDTKKDYISGKILNSRITLPSRITAIKLKEFLDIYNRSNTCKTDKYTNTGYFNRAAFA